MIYSRAILPGVLMLLMALGPLHAQFLDQANSELRFCLLISGYEEDTWFGEPASVAVDDDSGVLYVADRTYGLVDKFTLLGVPLAQFGAGSGLKSPIAAAVDKDGGLWITQDDSSSITIVSRKGEVTSFEMLPREGDAPPKPGRMAFDGDGSIYIVDQANSHIRVYDKEKKLRLVVGAKGNKRGQFMSLQDVAVDRSGRIFALDASGPPVQVFDRKGKYLYRIGFQGDGSQDIAVASAIFIDRNNQVWVVDRGQHALKVFDRQGNFLRRFGTYGTDEGMLFQPVDADMDSSGRIYIAEAGARRVQVFTLDRPFEPLKPMGL